MEIKRIPDSELEIMQVLWMFNIPMTTTAICEHLNKETESLLATTAKLLSRLTNRGFVTSYKKGHLKYYTPLVEEEAYLAMENRSFLERVNHNSIRRFLASLAQTKELTKEDIDALRTFIKEQEEHND